MLVCSPVRPAATLRGDPRGRRPRRQAYQSRHPRCCVKLCRLAKAPPHHHDNRDWRALSQPVSRWAGLAAYSACQFR
jgi:hypothetical protein